MKSILLILIYLFLAFESISQNHQTYSNMTIGGGKELIKIVAHTDSNLFVVGKKKNVNGIMDLYISRHNAFKTKADFDTCLNLTKIFKSGVSPNIDNFDFIQHKNHINLLFTAVGESGKILLGKIIDFNGTISEAFVVDKTDYTANTLEKCDYKLYTTNKKNILIHVNRMYKSGYRRDKCILLDQFFVKIWEYELPQINAKSHENIIVDVDNLNQLIYYPWEFATEKQLNSNGKIILQTVYREVKDTILPFNVGPLKYNMTFRKDSIRLVFVNPITKNVVERSFYYPFVMMPIIKSITSTQLLMYSMVDIDDENFVLMGKKAMYYKRFDFKNNTILLDTLVVLNEKIQRKLMHTYAPENKHPTAKYFKLYSENLVDGNLISVYEHGANGQFLEVFASNFNLTTNRLEWTCLLPRKINVYYPNIYDLVVRNFNNTTSISFYEHYKNIKKNNENYSFRKYKLLRKTYDKKFISYIISPLGDVSKKNGEIIDKDFLFPWLNELHKVNYFFISRDFLPVNFINEN